MARVERSGAEPDESADVTMTGTTPNSIKERILNDVQTILNVDDGAGRVLDGYLRNTLLAVELLLDKEIRERAAGGTPMEITLTKIENRLSKIERQNANLPTKAETYAGVARAAATAVKQTVNTNAGSKGIATTLAEARKAKEVLVRVEDGAEKQGVRGASDKDILERVKRAGGEHAKEAAAVRWLPSGDVLISMATKEAKEGLEKEGEWTKCLGKSAKVVRRGYGVLAHGIKVDSYDTTKQAEIIGKLLGQNRILHNDLQILKIAWPINAIKNKKIRSSLIIEVGTPAMANRLVREGLIDECSLRNCELFFKECRMTQCFNCYQYGHIANRCSNPTSCGHCARGHRSHDCPVQGAQGSRKCVVCGERGHEAWSRKCRIREKEAERVRASYEARPTLHPEAPTVRPPTPKNIDARVAVPKVGPKPASATTSSESTATSTPSGVPLPLSAGGAEHARPSTGKRAYNKRGPTEDPTPEGKEGNDKLVEWMATANRDRPVARPLRPLAKKHIIVENNDANEITEEQL